MAAGLTTFLPRGWTLPLFNGKRIIKDPSGTESLTSDDAYLEFCLQCIDSGECDSHMYIM